MNLARALSPNVETFGFALFLSLNATSVWGGIFPFLPEAAQTSVSTVSFFALQLAAASLTFLVAMAASYRRPDAQHGIRVLPGAIVLAASGIILVAAMYVEAASSALIVASALCFGCGSAQFLLGWQRVFSSQDAAAGSLSIIVGTGYSAVLYFVICLIPVALTAYLIPLVMVPLAGLCLWIAGQRVDFDQAMFQDRPCDHPAIYRNVMRESLGAAASIGALGFCAGAVRFILITHQSISSFVNLASMGVLLAMAAGYLLLWRARTIRFDVMNFYRAIFPVVAVGLLLLPFMGESVSTLGAAISYACFMLATVVMMTHCCQISRDSGISPVFIYALFGGVVYLIQTVGYFIGYVSGSESAMGLGQLSFVAMACLFALLAASLAAGQSRPLRTNRLEFLTLGVARRPFSSAPAFLGAESSRKRAAGEEANAPEAEGDADKAGNTEKAGQPAIASEKAPAAERLGKSRGDTPAASSASAAEASAIADAATREAFAADNPNSASMAAAEARTADSAASAPRGEGDSPHVLDRLSKQCLHAAERYGLSSRETEVAELLARGRTGPAIAEELFISENTVRTHIKRIYAKVGVNKKQELLAALEHAEP